MAVPVIDPALAGCNEIPEEEIETQKRACVYEEIQQVHQRVFLIDTRLESVYGDSKNPRVQRAPVGVDSIVPIASPIGVAHVEV